MAGEPESCYALILIIIHILKYPKLVSGERVSHLDVSDGVSVVRVTPTPTPASSVIYLLGTCDVRSRSAFVVHYYEL